MGKSEQSKIILRSAAGRTIRDTVRECLEACDWQQAVPPGATVVIKPNLCTAVAAKAEMSNTCRELTAAVCEVLLTRARHIYLGESDCLRQKAQRAFEVSGYPEMARQLGVEMVNFSEMPQAKVNCPPVGEIELPQLLLDADVFVTLPVLKTHALTYFTGALKNQWGCVPRYDRILLHRYLDPLLASLNALLRPRLAVMDAIVAAEGRGPVNGKPRRLDLVLASRDPVALDATAMRLVGLDPGLARHVVLSADQGVGRMAEEAIVVNGDFAGHATHFEPAVLDIAVAAMNRMSRYPWFVKYVLEPEIIFRPGRELVQILRKIGVVEGARRTRPSSAIP